MWDRDRAADHERDCEYVIEFGVGNAQLGALDHVVGDAVVATKNNGRDQPEHLVGFGGQGAIFVDIRIDIEESSDLLMLRTQEDFVECDAFFFEFGDGFAGH